MSNYHTYISEACVMEGADCVFTLGYDTTHPKWEPFADDDERQKVADDKRDGVVAQAILVGDAGLKDHGYYGMTTSGNIKIKITEDGVLTFDETA